MSFSIRASCRWSLVSRFISRSILYENLAVASAFILSEDVIFLKFLSITHKIGKSILLPGGVITMLFPRL